MPDDREFEYTRGLMNKYRPKYISDIQKLNISKKDKDLMHSEFKREAMNLLKTQESIMFNLLKKGYNYNESVRLAKREIF